MVRAYQNTDENELVKREIAVAESYVIIYDAALDEKAEVTTALAHDYLTASRTLLGKLLGAPISIEETTRREALETIRTIDSLIEYRITNNI